MQEFGNLSTGQSLVFIYITLSGKKILVLQYFQKMENICLLGSPAPAL